MNSSVYIPRWLQDQLSLALRTFPLVVLSGARQSGKSTLSTHLQPNRRYLTLDDLDVLDQARRSPDSLLVNPPLTIDEAQRAPELLLAIKRQIDKERNPGDFLLTGSARFSLMRGVADSLAGRAVYLDLPPFCPLEWQSIDNSARLFASLFDSSADFTAWELSQPNSNWLNWILLGGFAPALHCPEMESRALWFGGYVKTYLERDLRELSNIASLPDFRRLMQILAQRTGRLLNQADVARDGGISHATCHRYINLLETGYLIERLPPFTANPTLALVKSPKVFCCDSGLAAWLAGIHDRATLERRNDLGFWLEQAVFQTLQSWRSCDPFRRRLSYWRTRGGAEVDFILEQNQQTVALEIKAASRVGLDDSVGIRQFIETQSRKSNSIFGVVLYGGGDIRFLDKNIVALPYGALFRAGGAVRSA